ncbi:unnamed protein product [Rangifer tarandus platyrhynchus]|uniref:Uncharacterized protein n=1 Tax=Rangifer tarandus platyrhynchus TaxID=3082113 RepID=A0ABN8XZP4_RANTA|nr:unnamed protein product [Rangifer tarandus platyrhynchus]
MCRAGRRGFVSPISRADLQDGDEAVRQESRTGRPLKMPAAPATIKATHLLRLVSARTRESRGRKSQRKRGMTLGLQKGRRKASCVSHGIHGPDDIGTHHQLDSVSGTRRRNTAGRYRCRHSGHRPRTPEETLRCREEPKAPLLPSTTPERDGFPAHKEVGEYPGAHDMSTKDK